MEQFMWYSTSKEQRILRSFSVRPVHRHGLASQARTPVRSPQVALRLALIAAFLACYPLAAAHAEYRLGPQDKVRIRVYDWRAATAQVHEWTALGGEFIVGASGTLLLPLLGELPAADRTPSEIAAEISERLQTKIGLARRPDSAVEVLQYRPFYILGYVEKPGEYAYRPGMTVLEAMGLAGGILRTTEFRRLQREAITSKGELQMLETERVAQLTRLARLEAELNSASEITFPPELLDQKSNPVMAAMMREEQRLFATRRQSLRSQLESLEEIKSLLKSEITSLEAKSAGLQRQLALARQELEGISRLVDRGLAVTSRRLSMEQTTAQFESALLDLGLAKLRAQQDISKSQRDAADLANRRSNDVLVELGNVRTKLATMAEKRLTLERLISDAELIVPRDGTRLDDKQQRLRISILRATEGRRRSTVVQEMENVQPGDVVQVEPDSSVEPVAPPSLTRFRSAPYARSGAVNPEH
jgi:exopolysaccharide production protein ExoF